MDFIDELKKTYNWEDKPALHNDMHAKANHKITFLITLCLRLSMLLCTGFFP